MKSFKTIIRIGVLQLFMVLSTSISVKSQTFTVNPILYNGDPNKFINFVYMGDGYRAKELSTYMEHEANTCDYLFTNEPFMQYKNYFNVFAINVISNNSGAKHPRTAPDCPPKSKHPLSNADNYFGSTFDYDDIHRLLVPINNQRIYKVLLKNFPLYDGVFVLVNTPYYGGSGTWLATSSTHEYGHFILVHEIGHSFADLADEYWAGSIYAEEKANMTQETNPNLVKWKNWIGYDSVGIYRHGTGEAANWYRPHENCKMRVSRNPFCPVCTEAIVLKIIEHFGNPVLSYYPNRSNISLTEGDSIQFNLNIVKPNPNTIRVKWLLNETVLSMNTDSITIFSNQLLTGINTLSAKVLDTTDFIRADNHEINNTFSVDWTINKNTTKPDFIKIYPVPASDDLIIEIKDNEQTINFEIFNLLGKKVYEGNFVKKTIVKTDNFAPGVYIITLENGQLSEFRKFVKQ